MAQNLKNIKANASLTAIPSMTVTGNSTLNNVTLTGNIIPNVANVYGLGNVTHYFKDAFIGPGSLYVNGKKVLEDVSGTINFTTDINQNLKISTSGSGDIQFDPTGTGVVAVKGTLQLEAGSNITSSDGSSIRFANPIATDSITTNSANTDLTITANGTGIVRVSDDMSVSGNFTVTGTTTYINTETIQLYDNIIDLNSNFTTGSPTENAGIRIMRGDEAGVLIRWNESTDKWQYTNDGSTYVDFVGTTSTGNTSLSNIAISNYFSGNGSLLTFVTGSNVSGNVTGAVQAHYANIANSVAGANVSGNVSSAVQAHYANIANSVAVSNVSGIGNIATINIDGNVSNILYGNGIFAAAPAGGGSYGNSNVATFLGSYGSNTIITTGNVSVGNIIGNGQALTGLTGANVSGNVTSAVQSHYANIANSVAGANVSGAVSYATTANAVAGANVSGTVAQATYAGTANSVAGANVSGAVSSATSATTAGTVTTAAQGNITSVGTLTSLSTGTITISANANIGMSGTLSQISGANLLSATYLSGDGSSLTNLKPNLFMTIALSDESTAITTGVGKVAFRAPFAMTLYQIPRASLSTASTSGIPEIDINKNGTTIFSTRLTIDANEKTSVTAATAAAMSTTTFADDDEISMDIDVAGTGAKGLKVTLYYRRT
jgi:hypothetical protein